MQTVESNPAFFSPLPPSLLPIGHPQDAAHRETTSAPTLLATRLQLELLLGNRSGSVDLREAAGVILNDLGATLEVFRLAGEECCANSDGTGAASRLEDCLASLGTEVWMDAVCANAVERIAGAPAKLADLTVFWEHARSVAYSCWLLAEDEEGVCPEEAYLVGLLHDAGQMPELLGWVPAQFGGAGVLWTAPMLSLLAQHWRLPQYLEKVVAGPGVPSRWTRLLEAAHAWSRRDALPMSSMA